MKRPYSESGSRAGDTGAVRTTISLAHLIWKREAWTYTVLDSTTLAGLANALEAEITETRMAVGNNMMGRTRRRGMRGRKLAISPLEHEFYTVYLAFPGYLSRP